MYKLYYTTKDFKPFGNSVEKVPLLVKIEDMNFEIIPTKWFFYLALESGNTTSPETWRSYAEAIYDWFQTCSINNWEWKNVTREHLLAYKNNMLTNNSSHNRPYSKNTINGYLKRICLFYEWCFKHKHIEHLPFQKEEIHTKVNINDSNFLSHLKTQNVIYKNDLIVKNSKKIPHCLTPQELNNFLNQLEERDQLIVKWSVMTGIRRKEVLGLKLSDLPSQLNNELIQKLEITITKGNKPRAIFVPQSLLDETNQYIKTTRRMIAKKFNTLNNNQDLWLGKTTGKLISNKALNKNCSEAFKKADINATFHHLRHTYAIKMLTILTKKAQETGINPLKTLQVLLGHSNISTTMIYLESLSIDINEIEDSLNKLYGDLLYEEKI